MEKILVIDDSLLQAQFLSALLQNEYEVQLCTDAESALTQAKATEPSLILLDGVMPKISGFELLPLLKADAQTKDIPVIMISSLSDVGNEKAGLDLGAVDYIVKPYSAEIVRARVRTHVRIFRLQRSLEELMSMDALTGVNNRRYIEERCGKYLKDCIQTQGTFSLGILDVDYFKKYNDAYGHLAGDAALRIVAQTAAACLQGDMFFFARYGGEEFVLGMIHIMAEEAGEIAQKITKDIVAAKIPHHQSDVSPFLTVSIGGLTGVPKAGETLEDWLRQADANLYQAKNQGRNRVLWGLKNE